MIAFGSRCFWHFDSMPRSGLVQQLLGAPGPVTVRAAHVDEIVVTDVADTVVAFFSEERTGAGPVDVGTSGYSRPFTPFAMASHNRMVLTKSSSPLHGSLSSRMHSTKWRVSLNSGPPMESKSSGVSYTAPAL